MDGESCGDQHRFRIVCHDSFWKSREVVELQEVVEALTLSVVRRFHLIGSVYERV